MHCDAVHSFPPDVEQLAYTKSCPNQGMYIPKRLITIQGHPEFNEEIMTEILEKWHESGVLDNEMYEDSMARVNKYQDGVVVAAAFLKFCLE
jgi:GMP synthase-like glutamine amidotransferase